VNFFNIEHKLQSNLVATVVIQ